MGDPNKRCTKVQFASFADAKRAAQKSKRRLVPYSCKLCGAHHLTSMTKKDLRKARKLSRSRKWTTAEIEKLLNDCDNLTAAVHGSEDYWDSHEQIQNLLTDLIGRGWKPKRKTEGS